MGTRTLVQPGYPSAADLLELLAGPADPVQAGPDIPWEELSCHLGIAVSSRQLFHEMDWHIREAGHLSTGKSRCLTWPVVGFWIRDQHEINRLLLVAMEMACLRLEEVERAAVRHFSRYRTEERANWVKRFRHMGLIWKSAKAASRRLRDLWEQGRNRRWRRHSRASQADMNLRIEECLVPLAEIAAILLETLDGGNGLTAEVQQHLAACLWHAKEGKAVREAAAGRLLADPQRQLNRLYRITLEEVSFLLKDLVVRVNQAGLGKSLVFSL